MTIARAWLFCRLGRPLVPAPIPLPLPGVHDPGVLPPLPGCGARLSACDAQAGWRRLAGVLVGLAVGLGGAAGAGETTDQVEMGLQRLAAIARDPVLQGAAKADERQAKTKAFILQWFDVPEMARQSLASHWAEHSPQEQQEFIELFADLLAGTYTQLVVDHLSRQQVHYLSEAIDGSVATVKAQFPSRRDEPTMVAFELLRRQNGWALYDVVIDEVSLLRTYRTRFDKVIRAQSYEALVKALQRKRESEAALW